MSSVPKGAKSPVRMTPAFFHILLSMVDEEKHGYAIMREVSERTSGTIRLGPGSLYWSINRLQEAGLIEEADERPDPDNDDERRRYYRLSGLGRDVLTSEAETLAEIVAYARAKKVIGKPRLVR